MGILKNFHCTVSSSHFVRNPSKMAENPEDLNLPTAVVKRIVSDAVPASCKVSKEANAAIAKAASVFVLYATSCANNVAQKSHRKTLTGADVIKAIHEMEFDKFVKPLEASLESWKASQAKKKEESSKRKKAKEELNKNKEKEEAAASTASVAAEDGEATERENKENKSDDE